MIDQDLQAELLRRMTLDQEARDQVQGHSDNPRLAEWAAVRHVDTNNTTWLADLVATCGWPLLSMVGDDAATAAWLLAQHADDAPELQLIFHQQMTAATALGEALYGGYANVPSEQVLFDKNILRHLNGALGSSASHAGRYDSPLR